MATLNCPGCGSDVEYASTDTGKSVKCESCGTDILLIDASSKELIALKCPSCGGEIKFIPGTNRVKCEFCDSTFMVPPELIASREGDMSGENYIAPFTINRQGVLEKTLEWLDKGFFTPGDADKVAVIVKLAGKYVPTFIFACDAQSEWIGEYSTTHYRTVTRTRYNPNTKRNESYRDQEQYKTWHRTSGTHHGNYRFPVSGAPAKFPQKLTNGVASTVERYENDMGAVPANTFDAEGVSIIGATMSVEEAWRLGMGFVDDFENSACQSEVERLSTCNTKVSNMKSRLFFQPIWDFTYKYKGKEYNAIMDGRIGTIEGGKPKSKLKIIILVTIIVIVVILLLIFICGVCGTGGLCSSMSLVQSLPSTIPIPIA